jgi:hypothetical protein
MPVRVKKTRQNKKIEPRSDSIGTEKALGLAIDDSLSLGLVLGSEDVQYGLVDDPRRSLRSLLGEQLDSGLCHGDGYGIDEHGELLCQEKLSPACLRFVNRLG